MAVTFVKCTSVEQADEMYWAGLLLYGSRQRWHPDDYTTDAIRLACQPSNIYERAAQNIRCGYLLED